MCNSFDNENTARQYCSKIKIMKKTVSGTFLYNLTYSIITTLGL